MVKRNSEPKHWLILPAAGIGSRMGSTIPKQYLNIDGQTIIARTIEAMTAKPRFETVLVGLRSDDSYFNSLPVDVTNKCIRFVGGDERADTVLAGLMALSDKAADHDWVWVHDAARPLITEHELELLEKSLLDAPDGALLALPSVDTIKCSKNGRVDSTLDRNIIWRAQTPQAFPYALLRDALRSALKKEVQITDESSAMEFAGHSPLLVEGRSSNIKVTKPEDLAALESTNTVNEKTNMTPDLRVGTGYDVHAFENGEFVTLGGVRIPHSFGLKAHSDGDVLLHAICDAMLGALALGDIGKHFPDTDDEWSGADSRFLLRAVNDLIQSKGFSVNNLDSTIIAQAPKMLPHIDNMRQCIAEDLGIDVDRVSVKATTTEKLGFTGRKEGIACDASVMLMRQVSV
ncbi:hypothetical protein A3715_16220 [Oleiphilus sp. HI0009]|nr:hypothetical protein A3715_16220 [Oleiphilus sp. HI0009]KZY61822.1 hypothetical protein A3738_13465 [Oleiphilus sp. HI0066]KZY69806.1 hypothetical protein A3738_25435 [Oleiphilus sp. HI0066]KZY69973.1 hypothetical protein A3739_07510 [Oleiphilus sp. HI0067]